MGSVMGVAVHDSAAWVASWVPSSGEWVRSATEPTDAMVIHMGNSTIDSMGRHVVVSHAPICVFISVEGLTGIWRGFRCSDTGQLDTHLKWEIHSDTNRTHHPYSATGRVRRGSLQRP